MNACQECEGRGVVSGFRIECRMGARFVPFTEKCSSCDGAGEITDLREAWIRQGEQLRASRLARDMSLREFARCLGVKPSALSNAERGRVDPTPMRATLRKIVGTLERWSAPR